MKEIQRADTRISLEEKFKKILDNWHTIKLSKTSKWTRKDQ